MAQRLRREHRGDRRGSARRRRGARCGCWPASVMSSPPHWGCPPRFDLLSPRALQALAALSEAWHASVTAAGGTVEPAATAPRGRHRQSRAASAQCAARRRRTDRRAAPLGSPRAPARPGADRRRGADPDAGGGARRALLVHARRTARPALVAAARPPSPRPAPWPGCARLRDRRQRAGRARRVAQPPRLATASSCSCLAVFAQILRNWLVLHASASTLGLRRDRRADRDRRAEPAAHAAERRRRRRRADPRRPRRRAAHVRRRLLTATGIAGALRALEQIGVFASSARACTESRFGVGGRCQPPGPRAASGTARLGPARHFRAPPRVCRRVPRASDRLRRRSGRRARIMLVGEEPGDQEDRQTRPVRGPGGQGARRRPGRGRPGPGRALLTNAVKHFKFVQRGKRRIHQTPTQPARPRRATRGSAPSSTSWQPRAAGAARGDRGEGGARLRIPAHAASGRGGALDAAPKVMATKIHPSAHLRRARDQEDRQRRARSTRRSNLRVVVRALG